MRRLLLGLCLLLGTAAAVPAATVPYRTDGDLVALSDRVVRGRVVDSVVAQAPDGAIQTHTRIAVLEDLAGGGGPIVTVVERGGRLPDGRRLWIPGTPAFLPGEEVVLCLQQRGAAYRTVALAYSAFRVGPAILGRRTLRRFASNLSVVGRPADPAPARTLAEFAGVVASLTGASARPVLSEAEAAAVVAAAAARAPMAEPFTLLGPLRWREADAGTPIVWYRNTLTPSPIQGADTDGQIGVALHAWTAPAAANITLNFGGTRLDPLEADADPYCTSQNLGAAMITFGDPRDELAPGVLAIGGGCGAAGSLHTVNGVLFSSFSHGLVVMNDDLIGFTTPPNVTRVLEHEIGHAIGLGHTCEDECAEADTVNIMFPACCFDAAPIPPAIGPDDLAGVVFIYPPSACTYTIVPSALNPGVEGGRFNLQVTASSAACTWTAVPAAPWVSVPLGPPVTGSATLPVDVAPNVGSVANRTTTLTIDSATVSIVQPRDQDTNGDGLFEGWTAFFGLDPATGGAAHGPGGDLDGDGISNLAEQTAGSHPRGTHRRYLAEGVSNAFFDTEVALFNPAPLDDGTVVLRVQPEGGGNASWMLPMHGGARRTVTPNVFESLVTAPFSMLVESDRPLVVDRIMRWDASGYGSHAETALPAPATSWFLAEGSTAGEFALFYLLQNPGDAAASATVRFLRPAGRPAIERTYTLAPRARLTIPVDTAHPDLASTDVSAVVTATQPIVVERAMYLSRPGQPFAAGHESAGVTAAATSWFLAEGATGTFFDLFLLIANPGTSPAAVRVDYLLPGGGTLTKSYSVGAESRFTIYVDEEQIPAGSGQRPLAATTVGMRVTSTNGQPIVVERAMWWPQPVWYEAHNAPATTVTGTRWALAAGSTGGATTTETYVLIANTANAAGTARVTVYAENGNQITRQVALPPESRTNVAASSLFPEVSGQRFATLVESIGASPVPIVVERATYDTVNGVLWSAGTAAGATRLTP